MTKAKRKIKSKTRLAILAGQKIAQATGVAATVLILGTLGGLGTIIVVLVYCRMAGPLF